MSAAVIAAVVVLVGATIAFYAYALYAASRYAFGVPNEGVLWSRVYAPRLYRNMKTDQRTSRGFLRVCYGRTDPLVWVRVGSDTGACDLDCLPLQARKAPFVLVTSDGDREIPAEVRPATVEALTGSPLVRHWYAQNLVRAADTSPKLRHLPIGLSVHMYGFPASTNYAQYFKRLQDANPWATRNPKIFMDFGSKSHPERAQVRALLQDAPNVEVLRERIGYAEIHARYAAHRYVVSVRGNGWDCHRTWEALCAGAVVLVRAGPLDPMYDGVPGIHILQAWDEILAPGFMDALDAKYAKYDAAYVLPMMDPDAVRANMLAGRAWNFTES